MRVPFLVLVAALLAAAGLSAAERIPPPPARYFNDYAGVVSRPVADRLNARLEQFERESSSQLLVVIFPRMESGSSIEDYTVRVAQAWRVGRKDRDNGAVLFSFMQEHKLYLQVGYGLEGAIPDATAKRIIQQEIVPRFRAGDIGGGMTAAVDAMIAAARGEYQGTGETVADSRRGSTARGGLIFAAIVGFVILMIIASAFSRNNGRGLLTRGNRGLIILGNDDSWSGGGSSWGGGGGGGGGFSGGGGSFGGGGAGGSW